MCECNQGSLGYGPDGDLTFCDCAEGIKAALKASCRLISLYSDQLAVFDRLAPLPPKMKAMRDEIWIAYNLECLAHDGLHGGGEIGGDAMTYICRPCSTKHDIPRREDRPEVGVCPICQDVHALYLVKREPAPDAGPWILNIEQGPATQANPWVLVEDALPEQGVLVLMAYHSAGARQAGWFDGHGQWKSQLSLSRSKPDYWCPIAPLPGSQC